MILVTGGAGFIGSNFVLDWLSQHDEAIFNLDKLTYAGNLQTLNSLVGDARHVFVRGDIGDRARWQRGGVGGHGGDGCGLTRQDIGFVDGLALAGGEPEGDGEAAFFQQDAGM